MGKPMFSHSEKLELPEKQGLDADFQCRINPKGCWVACRSMLAIMDRKHPLGGLIVISTMAE